MAEKADDMATATSGASQLPASPAPPSSSSSKPSRMPKLPSFRDRDREKDGSSSSLTSKLMEYMSRDRSGGKDREEDGSSSGSLTSKLFKDRDKDKDKDKDGSSSGSLTSKFFRDRDKDKDKDKERDGSSSSRSSKLRNFSFTRTPSGKSVSMESDDIPAVPPLEERGRLAPVKEEGVASKEKGGALKESSGSVKEGDGDSKERSSVPREGDRIPDERRSSLKEQSGEPREGGGASQEGDRSVKEGGEEKQGKEKDKDSKDASPPEADTSSPAIKKKEKEKRGFFSPRHKGPLFSFSQIFTTSHKQKNVEIHKIFSSLPESEKLIDDFSCALQRDILIHGRLYLTQNWLCFYANIFSWETLLTIPFQSVQAITKEKTALVIPNAIQISTTAEKYGFSSLVNRDVTHSIVVKIWQNSFLPQPLSPLELVRVSKKAWGESTDVGSEDDLWGHLNKKRSAKIQKQMSMPTHVELGVLPTPTIPPTSTSSSSETSLKSQATNDQSDTTLTGHSADEREVKSLPPRLEGDAKDMRVQERKDPEPTNDTKVQTSSSDSGHVSGPTTLPAPFPPDNPETMSLQSLGGDSLASSEYETVSFSDEQGEIACGCSEHLGRTIINEVYNTDVETLFQLLFTDSDFIRTVFKARKAINLDLGDWHPQSDGTRLRDISYTLALNYSFGPKFTTSTEHHTYSKMGQPGLKHIVDSEVANGNIPYSDTFFVSCRFCITRVALDKTRFRVSANINFKKSCWGLVKNLIEKNAGDGIRSHYSCLDTLLKEYLVNMPVKQKRPHRRVSRRSRHRRQSSITKPIAPLPAPTTEPSSSPQGPPTHRRGSVVNSVSYSPALTTTPGADTETSEEKKQGASHSLPRVNMALTLLLGILIVSNMALYHHLMSYQGTGLPSQVTPPPTTTQLPHQRIEWPTSKSEWIRLVRQQLEGHDKEIRNWHNTFSTLVEALEQIEDTVSGAKKVLVAQLQSHDPAVHAQKEWDSIASSVRREATERTMEGREPDSQPEQVLRKKQTEPTQEL